ncbi:MAG: LON peptidase substrate-binding domain-containing protein [Myxococcota bacterium]
MDHHRLAEICRHLPIFPLPRTVLLPGAELPLHVFEPRYRELVAHCIAGDGVMGIATLRPGYEANYEGRPDIWPEVGVGEIVGHQPFPDGRSNIVLRYAGRVRVARELPPTHPFREIDGVLVEEDEGGLERALVALKVLVIQLGGLSPSAAGEARRLIQLDGIDLVDALARRLFEEPDEQRAYLGAPKLVDRVARVHARLATYFVPRATVGET